MKGSKTMTDIRYAYKYEDTDDKQKCTRYTYLDCFSDQAKSIVTDEAFGDLEYEATHKIIVDGDNVNNIIPHVVKLMRARNDDLEFTDLKVYLTIDCVLCCNVDLSTRYVTVSNIVEFIQTLINSTDGQGLSRLELDFSRPDIDNDEFALIKNY